jgi:hypothetical protein
MVSKDYQAKNIYTQADLHQAFLEMCCVKGANVKEFLMRLCCKHEELVAAKVLVTEKEYERTILQGIPGELVTFTSQLLSLAAIIDKSAAINFNALMNQICKEANRLKSRRTKGGKKDTTDEALTATASDDRRQWCHNCGKKGHWANEC